MSYIYPSTSANITKYKVYFVYFGQKIYLGIFNTYEEAKNILTEANTIMSSPSGLPDFSEFTLNYKKIICLCNLRDNKTYIKNPIYIYPTYFHYYLSKSSFLIFDLKELFYFSTYKIYKRGSYLYTQDSVSQQSILSRFGILNHSIVGKDYRFRNDNPNDFRQDNIEIINAYKGVTKKEKNNCTLYTSSIYIDKNIVLGHYSSEIEAAIAYNKAIDYLIGTGTTKNFVHNAIPFITKDEYQMIYEKIILSPRFFHLDHQRKRVISTKKYRGITKENNSFKVNIGYHSKQYYLGMYPTEKRAAQAYNYASFYLFGRQGYVNEVSPLIDDRDTNKILKFLTKNGILKEPHSS